MGEGGTPDPIKAPPINAAPGDGAVPAQTNVQTRHLVPVRIWAAGIKTPLRFDDKDVRLEEEDRNQGDKTYGQDGWDVGLDFANFEDLGEKLGNKKFILPSFIDEPRDWRGEHGFKKLKNVFSDYGPIEENQITRLAIFAHGAPGGLDIDGSVGRDMDGAVATDPTMLNVTTIGKYSKQFDQIQKVLAFRAKVFFMCCLTGAETVGDEFLKAVSVRWQDKEITVIGFRSVLYCNGAAQAKKGSSGSSAFPGARETHYSNNKVVGAPTRYYEGTGWNDLTTLPWASERTPHATQAFKGFILKQGTPSNPYGQP